MVQRKRRTLPTRVRLRIWRSYIETSEALRAQLAGIVDVSIKEGVVVQRKRRTLPTRAQLRIWRSYIETSEALRAQLAGRLQSESGFSSGDYLVLLALSESPDNVLRSSALADQIGWERSRLSHHLGRMEKRGLIERATSADDGHGIDIAMTRAGSEAFRASTVPHLRAVRELFLDALSVEQLAQIEGVTAALRAHLGLATED